MTELSVGTRMGAVTGMCGMGEQDHGCYCAKTIGAHGGFTPPLRSKHSYLPSRKASLRSCGATVEAGAYCCLIGPGD